MKKMLPEDLIAARFERALQSCLEALDRVHYPETLVNSLEAVLLARQGGSRGVPLLIETLTWGEKRPSANRLVASECMLRGFLLLAEAGLPETEVFEKSLGRKLGAEFSQAQLLLTADTLFTWALELTAGECDSSGKPLPGSLSFSMGIEGSLAGLDRARPTLAGLLDLDPVQGLAGSFSAREAGADRVFRLVSRWIFLSELSLWFGSQQIVSPEIGKIERKLDRVVGEGPSKGRTGLLYELVLFLKSQGFLTDQAVPFS